MYQEQLDPLLRSQPSGRMILPYFKDRYAVALLRYLADDGRPLREIRNSRQARLLDKPFLRRNLYRLGHGKLDWDWLDSLWPACPERYRITLGDWGVDENDPYWQTSRRGKSLVLQVNFTAGHDRRYRELIRPVDEEHPFESTDHPVQGEELRTLSWARIDLDLDDGEALIEEVQTDWLRDARSAYEVLVRRKRVHLPWCLRSRDWDRRRLRYYYEQVLARHLAVWDELTLFAAIHYLREQLGIHRIFYHSYRSGNWIKGFDRYWHPPRSLYTELPRRFCFELQRTAPRFLARAWARIRRPGRLSRRRERRFRRRALGRRRLCFYLLELP